jgi:hypothetical protein
MSFEETDTEDSASSLSEVSSLDDDFDTMHLESDSSHEEVADDDMDPHIWNEIEPESDAEFLEDHRLIERVTSISEDNTINPIGISLRTKLLNSWFVKLIYMHSNTCNAMRLVDGRYFINGKQPLMKRCSSSLESFSKWGWCKCRN